MRSTFKVLFYVNGGKEKNGVVPIMGRITINGTVSQFSCKRTIATNMWDAKGNRAKGKSKESQEINFALENIKAQIIKHYQRISDRESYVTAEIVRNAYQGIGTEYETILGAYDKHNTDFKKRVGKDRSKATYLKHTIVRRHIANFIKDKYKRSDISMNELTEDFIRDYHTYLQNSVGLEQGTMRSYIAPLRTLVTRAHYNGLIPRNPFAQYRVSPSSKEREFLTEEELRKLMNHKFSNMTHSIIRDMFLFSAMTGISYIDMKNLTRDDIVDINGSRWIVSKRKKSNIAYRVKLVEPALVILDRYEPFMGGRHIFPIGSNQRANRMLKDIAKECGIDKVLTYHQSRHSFAVLAISKGMPIESVSKILGHTKITTTQIYAKVTTDKLDNDISQFEDRLCANFKTN